MLAAWVSSEFSRDRWMLLYLECIGILISSRALPIDPFFTTKPMGQGTGQGLAITYNIIVEKHGGELTFESEVDVGTTFRVRLPLTATNSDEIKVRGPKKNAQGSYVYA